MDLQSLYVLCVIYCMSVNMLDFVPCCHFLPQVRTKIRYTAQTVYSMQRVN